MLYYLRGFTLFLPHSSMADKHNYLSDKLNIWLRLQLTDSGVPDRDQMRISDFKRCINSLRLWWKSRNIKAVSETFEKFMLQNLTACWWCTVMGYYHLKYMKLATENHLLFIYFFLLYNHYNHHLLPQTHKPAIMASLSHFPSLSQTII